MPEQPIGAPHAEATDSQPADRPSLAPLAPETVVPTPVPGANATVPQRSPYLHPVRLSSFMRAFNLDRATRRALQSPILVCEAPTVVSIRPLPLDETGQVRAINPAMLRTEAVLFPVHKGDGRLNALALSITVGRTRNNDVVLDDESVSRFHAVIEQDPKRHTWTLSDVGSKNGTWINGMTLRPNMPEHLQDESRVRLGNVELMFFLPESFFRYADAHP